MYVIIVVSFFTRFPSTELRHQKVSISPTTFNIDSFDEMDILMPILCRIGVWFHPQSRPIALESSSLGNLPLELIIHIAQFLLPESILLFCLRCWPIYSTLKSRYVKIIKDDQQLDRYKVLTLLERDLPDHILCY